MTAPPTGSTPVAEPDVASEVATSGRGSPTTDDAFRVAQPAFEGTLGELAHALRGGRVAPGDLDLYRLVRDFLAWFDDRSERDLALASEALPKVAGVIELKLRLLLPRPPRAPDDEDADEEVEEALAAVAMLDELERAIDFLRVRRRQRRVTIPAQAPRPDYPRAEPPLKVGPGRLSELAGRLRGADYFEMAIERLTLAGAVKRLMKRLRRLGRGLLFAVYPASDWATRTVVFSGMLELVRSGDIDAEQETPFGDIRVALPEPDAGRASRVAGPDSGADDGAASLASETTNETTVDETTADQTIAGEATAEGETGAPR